MHRNIFDSDSMGSFQCEAPQLQNGSSTVQNFIEMYIQGLVNFIQCAMFFIGTLLILQFEYILKNKDDIQYYSKWEKLQRKCMQRKSLCLFTWQ